MSDATLTTDSNARKGLPLMEGFLDYFPAAAAEVARLSREGNEKHNPGQPMHHARGKSSDHADCIVRHLIDRGTVDTDGFLHEVKVAWRAMALLQEELERRGAPLARGARLPEQTLEELKEKHPLMIVPVVGPPRRATPEEQKRYEQLQQPVTQQYRQAIEATFRTDEEQKAFDQQLAKCEWPECPECSGPSATDDCDATGVNR